MKKLMKMIVTFTVMLLISCNLGSTYAIENVKNMHIKISDATSAGASPGGQESGSTEGQSSIEGLGDLDAYHSNETTSRKLTSRLGNILGWIRAIGIILSVVILSMIGVKYMLTSVEGKAEYKKSMVPYIWGAAILFLGSYVPQLIYDIVKEIEG